MKREGLLHMWRNPSASAFMLGRGGILTKSRTEALHVPLIGLKRLLKSSIELIVRQLSLKQEDGRGMKAASTTIM